MNSKKLKPVLPSFREKKRYLVFEVLSNSRIKAVSEVSKAIVSHSLSFSGTFGVASAGLMVLPDKYHPESQRGMLRVGHRHVDHARAALATIRSIGNQPVIVRSVGASGIMRKAESKYMAG
jgi:RNase P/RNase MRP subunit POP5